MWKKSNCVAEVYIMDQLHAIDPLHEVDDCFAAVFTAATRETTTSPEAAVTTTETNNNKRKAPADAADAEAPSDKLMQQTRALLHKLHKAAGHPSNRNLARLCHDKKMPPWVVREALNLKCQPCIDTQQGERLIVPASLNVKPLPWQFVGMDVFELVYVKQKCKARYLLMVCLCMKLVCIEQTVCVCLSARQERIQEIRWWKLSQVRGFSTDQGRSGF